MNNAFFNKTDATEIIAVEFKTKSNQPISLLVKRDDKIDPLVSGNKWRKLKYNLAYAIGNGYKGVASFGGAFSNHIFALSVAGSQLGIKTLGFIRTHKLDANNPTLQFAKEKGMNLIALSRDDYQQRNNPAFIKTLQVSYPDYFFVPEGGSNNLAESGLQELATEINSQANNQKLEFSHIACAVGSGGTICGLAKHLPNRNFLGITVVKDELLFETILNRSSSSTKQIRLHHDAWFGGYGKFDQELVEFCLDFYQQTDIPIEPVYTGKLFYALCYQRQQLGLSSNDVVLAIHTGGLQGIAGQLYLNKFEDPKWRKILESNVPTDS